MVTLKDVADISQVVVGISSLFLAGYVFIYQRQKDKKNDFQTALLHEQNIKLQWFKELVVQPNLGTINQFYTNLHSIKEKITSDNMSLPEREDMNNYIKSELSAIRKTFIDILLQVDNKFGALILKNLDDLVDELTEAIFNDELKLKHPAVCEKHLTNKISYSKNSFLALLYNYKGLSS